MCRFVFFFCYMINNVYIINIDNMSPKSKCLPLPDLQFYQIFLLFMPNNPPLFVRKALFLRIHEILKNLR